MKVWSRSMVAAMAAAVLAAPLGAQVTVGTANSANCIPFGCTIAGFEATRYQQVYSASAFSGPLSINSISFFISTANYVSSLNQGTFTFYLSTTTAAVNGLSDTFADNLGADNQLFGTFTLGGPASLGELNFLGSTFNYDPTQGNLLLDIVANVTAGAAGSSYFDSETDSDVTSRALNFGEEGNHGLVTKFAYKPVTSVPEPASVMLLLTGVAGLAVTGKRRLS